MLRFALIGSPVKHSLSPRIYNSFFRARGIKARYEAVEVGREGLPGLLGYLKGLRGFNVTMPLKIDIVRYLDGVDEVSAAIGSVNTVSVSGGRMVGYNTDYKGFLSALSLDERRSYSSALIIGAGGAARAAVYALRGLVDRIHVVSRSGSTARSLALKSLEWGFARASWSKSGDPGLGVLVERSDLIVNASPVGMDGLSAPVDASRARPPCTVVDMVYRPLETPLLRLASRAGCTTIDGLWMLVGQASENLYLWLGARAGLEELRRYALGG